MITGKVKKIIVAVTGATGIIYAQKLLEILKQLPNIESHLIISPAAKLTLKLESSLTSKEFKALADVVHDYNDIADSLSSGSVKTSGMVIVPSSVKTLSSIANSYNNDLITRAADVTLKEGRKLVICLRETPLHLGHLRLMTKVVEHGATMMPLMPAFYHNPKSIEDIVNQGVARILDQLDIEYPEDLFKPWSGIK